MDITAQFDVHMQPAPTVVLKCIQAIESRGTCVCVCVCVFTSLSLISAGISMEGIYRVSPSLALVNKLRAEFDKGEHHEMNCLPPSHLPSLPPSHISLSLSFSLSSTL